MNKKSTLILVSILHICIVGICILTIYNNKHSGVTVAHISSDTKTTVSLKEPETAAETESASETTEETEIELITETIPEPEIESEPEPQTQPESTALCAFHFIGTHKNLNIRNAPSSKARIVGKIPVGGSGSVLELTNEYWALIEYNGTIGYCSRGWIELQETTE